MEERSTERSTNVSTTTLSSATTKYLKNLKIIVYNRPGVSVAEADAAFATLKKEIKFPERIAVCKEGDTGPIFKRNDIVVNKKWDVENEHCRLLTDDSSRTVTQRQKYSRNRHNSSDLKRTPPRETYSSRDRSLSPRSRRRSSTSYDRDTECACSTRHCRGYSHQSLTYSSKENSCSAYSRRKSRSPYKYKERSHSPSRKGSYKIQPSNQNKQVSSTTHKYTRFPLDYGYYGTEGFWVPGPIPRPQFLPKGVLPPYNIAMQGMIRPAYIIPRPYMPIPPQPIQPFRPRFVHKYYQPFRPKAARSEKTSTRTSVPATSTVTRPTVSDASSNVTSTSEDKI